jgi:hypothetical protein
MTTNTTQGRADARSGAVIERRERLGGLLNFYYRRVA